MAHHERVQRGPATTGRHDDRYATWQEQRSGLFLNVSMKGTIGLEASHDMTGRRVDTGLGKGGKGAAGGGGRGTGAGRRGADIAVGRGGETSDVVGEEKREGVAAVKVQESPSESWYQRRRDEPTEAGGRQKAETPMRTSW